MVIDRGHMSVAKTLCRVREAYVWLGMRRDIQTCVDPCTHCQVQSNHNNPQPMQMMPEAAYPFQIVHIDLVGPFVPSRRSNAKYLLTAIDHCSGYVEAIPLRNKSSDDVMEGLMANVVAR